MRTVQLMPLRPFLLTAGVGHGLSSTASAAGADVPASGGLVTSLGAGMAFPMPGLHFVVTVENRKSASGKMDFGAGNVGDMSADAWMGTVWVVF